MKTLLSKYPTVSRMVLAIMLFALALVLSGIVNKGIVKEYFPYSSVIFLFLATWILYRSENN